MIIANFRFQISRAPPFWILWRHTVAAIVRVVGRMLLVTAVILLLIKLTNFPLKDITKNIRLYLSRTGSLLIMRLLLLEAQRVNYI